MHQSYSAAATRGASARGRAVPAAATFYLQASITVSFLAGSSAPTPLYPIYQRAWGFSPVTITIVFGVYALAVLAALLFAGRLSDHVGRRPVLVASTLTQALAMVVLGTAAGVSGLVVGRIIQGLAAGAAVAAVGAGLIDLDRIRGPVANAIAPIVGTATGGLLGGLMVHYLPAPTHLVYATFGVIFVLQCAGVVLLPDTISPQPGALASLKPQFAVPPAVRTSMLLAVPMLIAAWSLAGLYASLVPALIRHRFGLDASLFGGTALFVMAASGAAAVLLLRRREARKMMACGATGLIVGVGAVLAALAFRSVGLFFLGTAFAGMGFGAGFQGAIRTVIPLAAPHERAGVLAVVFVVSYLAMGLPALAAGFAIAGGYGIVATAVCFGGTVISLAILALAGSKFAR
ncbi:MAG: transporter [Gammaproteobacteria bacterium]|nr:transporter [Gammaproteobacteria bacterium]